MGLTPFLMHMLAGAGIVGVVAGLALKDVVSNLFSGLLVRSQHLFALGDWVEVNNVFGQVVRAGTLTTTLENVAGQWVEVPNQLIYNQPVLNYSAKGKWHVIISCGVSYGDDLTRVRQVVVEELRQIRGVLAQEPIDCYFTEIGASTYQFDARYWIEFRHYADYLQARDEGIERLKNRFAAENISIAYNVLSLDFGVKGGVNLNDIALTVSQAQKAT